MSAVRARTLRILLAACLAGWMAAAGSVAADSRIAALRFSIPEGRVQNQFYRRGPTAAHLVLTSGMKPRVVFAFPAGNSGAALWFEAASAAFAWQAPGELMPVARTLADGSLLRGVSAELVATGGPLEVREAIIGSIRVIRNYQDGGEAPAREVSTLPARSGSTIVWQRRRLDGGAGYYLAVEVLAGELRGDESQPLVLQPDRAGRLRLRLTGLTGDRPLTPIAADDLLGAGAARDPRLRRALEFLSYGEKLLAGSWRFDTYFGRDTLMSLRLLAPVAQPALMEAGLGAVLERLDEGGEVAHEEDIGEFAVLRRRLEHLPPGDAPLLDYKMIDDDYMLAPVAALYLLDMPAGRTRAQAFLARRSPSGASYGALLARNFRFVIANTAPFARAPSRQNLIALKPGFAVGNWRDSERGLGGGRYPYDVNGVWAPAALTAIARLDDSGLLAPYLGAGSTAPFADAAAMARVWQHDAPGFFEVSVPAADARKQVTAYAKAIGVDAAPALASIDGSGLTFRALSLDAGGRAVAVLNSDEAFALLLLDLPPAEAVRIADRLTRPFPAGLLTGAGLLVANAAFADPALQPDFARNRYHGAVAWSWQQALLAAGIDRQLVRGDLTPSARKTLGQARTRLAAAMQASTAVRGSELWSWSQHAGRYRVEPFGQRREDETESNAAQLWSTVYLAQP